MKKGFKPTLPCWTVIGYYPDNKQRFADVVRATTADEAEQIVLTTSHESPVAICGVVSGNHQLQDTAENVAVQDDGYCRQDDEEE
ncbi:MAG: hypothetical protein M0036_00070 [Desulfobacteraceae bacterium]|nr:hypothetical protein [Desulfobacteraceae bacterium]